MKLLRREAHKTETCNLLQSHMDAAKRVLTPRFQHLFFLIEKLWIGLSRRAPESFDALSCDKCGLLNA